jgi:hypothetical protein
LTILWRYRRGTYRVWHLNGRCPEGTVPIRRIKEEDVLRASSVESFGKKNHPSIPKPKSADVQNSLPGHEVPMPFENIRLKNSILQKGIKMRPKAEKPFL